MMMGHWSQLAICLTLLSLPLEGCSLIFSAKDYDSDGGGINQCDRDGDGHYAMTSACGNGDDCDDDDANTYPGAPPDCSTPEHENCDAEHMADFRESVWGSSANTEAGFLRPFLIRGRDIGPHAAVVAAAVTEGGSPGGMGYVLWVEYGYPTVAHFDLRDPSSATVEDLTQLGAHMVFDAITLGACTANADDVAVSIFRQPDGSNPSGHVGTLSMGGMGLERSFVQYPFDFAGGLAESTIYRPGGVADCDIGWPEKNNDAPAHLVRGRFDNDNTSFISRLQATHLNSSGFGYFDYAAPPPSAVTSDAHVWTGSGRHAFFADENNSHVQVWDTSFAPPAASTPIMTGPTELTFLTDGTPATGLPSIAFVSGRPWEEQSYLVATPVNDFTYIRRIDCQNGGTCDIANLNLPSGDTEFREVAYSSATQTAMATWHTGDTDSMTMSPTRSGAALVMAGEDVEGVGRAWLHYMDATGKHIPLYDNRPDDFQQAEDATGTGLMALQVASYGNTSGSTLLVAWMQPGEMAGTQDIHIGGFQICERP